MNNQTKINKSSLIEVNVDVLKEGVRIKGKNDEKIIPWDAIKKIGYTHDLAHHSPVLSVLLKDGEIKKLLPFYKESKELLKIRKTLATSLKRYKN